jgi:DNA-binding NarL/FixJ family response regulator
MEEIINIAIADDHPLVRKGVIDFIELMECFNVIIEASDGDELINQLLLAAVLPDICILDISMPHLNGYQTLKEIKRNWLSIKVLIFSIFYNDFSVSEMFSNGANGYLKKNSSPKELQHALTSIYYKDFYLADTSAKWFSDHYLKHHLFPKITHREMEFLCHCCSELSYKEIADLMTVSARTIDTFRDSLFSKLNIKTRAGLVMFALQNGIVSLDHHK